METIKIKDIAQFYQVSKGKKYSKVFTKELNSYQITNQKNKQLAPYSRCHYLIPFEVDKMDDVDDLVDDEYQYQFVGKRTQEEINKFRKNLQGKQKGKNKITNKYYQVIVLQGRYVPNHDKKIKIYQNMQNNVSDFNAKLNKFSPQTLKKCYSGLTLKSKQTQTTQSNYEKKRDNLQDQFNTNSQQIRQKRKKFNQVLDIYENQDQNKGKHQCSQNYIVKSLTNYIQRQSKIQKLYLQKKIDGKNTLYSSFVLEQKNDLTHQNSDPHLVLEQNSLKYRSKEMSQSKILQLYVLYQNHKGTNKKIRLEEVPLGYEQQKLQFQCEYEFKDQQKYQTNKAFEKHERKINNNNNTNINANANSSSSVKKVLTYKNKLVSLFELKNSESQSDLNGNNDGSSYRTHSRCSLGQNSFFKFGRQTQSNIFDNIINLHGSGLQKDLDLQKLQKQHTNTKYGYKIQPSKEKPFSGKKSTASLRLSQTKLQSLQEQEECQIKFKNIKALKKSHQNIKPQPQATGQQTPRFGKIISFQDQIKNKKLCSSIIEPAQSQ